MGTLVRIRRVASAKELAQAFAIRMRVFVQEQGVPEEIELDADDRRAVHWIAFAGAKAVGTARIVRHGRSAKIGRMAVLRAYRRRGIGKKLLRRAVEAAVSAEVGKQRSEGRGRTSAAKEKRSAVSRRKTKIEPKQRQARGAKTIYLHAQVPVIGFYESMGFRAIGPVFYEAGIAHRRMVLAR